MNRKLKMLFKDTVVFALGSLGSKLILFFLVPIYTNFLTTEEYGIADLVFTTSQLIIPVVSIVIYDAVIRFGLAHNQNPAEVLKVGLRIGTLSTVITVLITPLIGKYTPLAKWKWYLCLYTVLTFNGYVFKNYLKVKNRNRLFALISVGQTLTMALLNIILLVILRIGVRGYLLSSIGASAFSLILSALASGAIHDLRGAKFNYLLSIEMVKYSVPLILNDLSWWVIHSSDKFMIESMVSAAALGLYTVSTKIPSLINVMISIFGQAWGISSIREIETSNDTRFFSKVYKGYSFITFISCIVLVPIIKPFMLVYVGEKFRAAWIFVPLLLVSAVFSSISSYYGQLYGALKKSINSSMTTLIAAAINIIINYVFILKYNIWGAVIGTVVAYFCLFLMRMIDVKRFISIDINYVLLFSNCALIVFQSIMVSLNVHATIISVIVLLIFIVINYKTILDITNMLRKKDQ